MSDPFKYFRVEAHEIVGDLAKGLGELEARADAALVTKLLRLAHTLKGAARIVRHKELAELAHDLETALDPLRDTPVAGRNEAALAILDQMSAHVRAMTAPVPAPAAMPAPEQVAVQAPPPARLESTAIDDALGGIASVHGLLARLRGVTDPTALARGVDQIERELVEVRRDVEHLRLSAAGSLYAALERTARDAAALAGKRVRFAFEGADVRVDGQVITALHGALVQLVRNAVVHGIEPAGTRTAAGKPAEGQITISAHARGRTISIACRDDGSGLDIDAIRNAVRRRGADPGALDAARAFQLLLGGGISTAREVTELAGRGIGLELVHAAVTELGGEVAVETSAAGTTITLIAPVAVTAIAVIDVALADRVVAIPQAAVRRVVRVQPREVVHGSDGTSLCVDDLMVPAAPLGALFGTPTDRATTAIILDGAAFFVDRTIGVGEVMVRSVPASAAALIDPIVWGMALDAGGRPYAVVEPRELVAAVGRARRSQPAPAARPLPILVVDDSLTTRMLEQSILESAGYEVELAVSAEDALVKLASGAYAMMLVDVEMPGMDGFSLVAELRARPALAHLPAVLVTSRDAEVDRDRGRAVGAQGYIVKGRFDQGELLALIRTLTAGARA
jgi:two-component system, chemotaxis family, sensor kinase CheA